MENTISGKSTTKGARTVGEVSFIIIRTEQNRTEQMFGKYKSSLSTLLERIRRYSTALTIAQSSHLGLGP